jgi:hypothetical protein
MRRSEHTVNNAIAQAALSHQPSIGARTAGRGGPNVRQFDQAPKPRHHSGRRPAGTVSGTAVANLSRTKPASIRAARKHPERPPPFGAQQKASRGSRLFIRGSHDSAQAGRTPSLSPAFLPAFHGKSLFGARDSLQEVRFAPASRARLIITSTSWPRCVCRCARCWIGRPALRYSLRCPFALKRQIPFSDAPIVAPKEGRRSASG